MPAWDTGPRGRSRARLLPKHRAARSSEHRVVAPNEGRKWGDKENRPDAGAEGTWPHVLTWAPGQRRQHPHPGIDTTGCGTPSTPHPTYANGRQRHRTFQALCFWGEGQAAHAANRAESRPVPAGFQLCLPGPHRALPSPRASGILRSGVSPSGAGGWLTLSIGPTRAFPSLGWVRAILPIRVTPPQLEQGDPEHAGLSTTPQETLGGHRAAGASQRQARMHSTPAAHSKAQPRMRPHC